ncbi:MAG TPA: hypothetical protein VFP53_01435, partial [Sphingomicrobium sp.]|nr:hypothetical protein [Sphingomicrobium sp.]
MTDSRADTDSDLPWLQEVEDEDAPRGIGGRAMFVGLLIVLIGAAAVAGTFFWLGRSNAGDGGPPQLIEAPDTPYKVKPKNPGGLDIAGESQTTFETSAGEDVDSRLNLPDTTEQPQPKTIPPGETKEPVAPEPPAPKPEPSGA